MRRLLLALPFALLPLTLAQAAEHAEHASLSAHAHGVAQLNAVLDGQTLELQLESPAMNLVGFEYLAKTAADQATVAAVRAELENPLSLFGLPATAGCTLTKYELESPLFGTTSPSEQHPHPAADDDDHAMHAEHDTHTTHSAENTAAAQSQPAEPAEHEEQDEHAEHEEAAHDDHAQPAKNAAGQDAMPEERHSEIHAHYQFECSTPAALKTLDLGPLFERFPTTQKIQVQLISPNGQQGLELTPRNSRLNF